MVIGICHIQLHIPESNSLKAKRQVIRRIKDRIRNKFNVSIAEVDNNDLWQRASLAIAIVNKDRKFANQVLSSIADKISQDNGVNILDYKIELI